MVEISEEANDSWLKEILPYSKLDVGLKSEEEDRIFWDIWAEPASSAPYES